MEDNKLLCKSDYDSAKSKGKYYECSYDLITNDLNKDHLEITQCLFNSGIMKIYMALAILFVP